MTADRTDTDFLVDVSPKDMQRIFDEQARRHLGMSGEEFIRSYKEGHWPNPDADPDVMYMVMLLPLGS
jgi:hypothetical protein